MIPRIAPSVKPELKKRTIKFNQIVENAGKDRMLRGVQ